MRLTSHLTKLLKNTILILVRTENNKFNNKNSDKINEKLFKFKKLKYFTKLFKFS